MFIAGRQLNATVPEIIESLRVYMEELVEHYFKDIRLLPNDLMVTCPNHKGGNERKPSCGIRLSDGFVHCFTCGYSVPLQEMVSNVLGYDDGGAKGIQWLFNNFIEEVSSVRENIYIEERNINKVINYIDDKELDSYRYYNDYMWKRGLTPELVEKYDIGYDKDFMFRGDKTKLMPCLTFPIKDRQGRVITVVRRSISSKVFVIPDGIKKPIYGLFEAEKSGSKEVIICESVFNALTCIKYGKMAIALLGTGSENQYEILKHTNFKKFIIGLDGDNAGDLGTKKLIKNLGDRFLISKLIMPRDGRDINDMSKEEFYKLKEISKNF